MVGVTRKGVSVFIPLTTLAKLAQVVVKQLNHLRTGKNRGAHRVLRPELEVALGKIGHDVHDFLHREGANVLADRENNGGGGDGGGGGGGGVFRTVTQGRTCKVKEPHRPQNLH